MICATERYAPWVSLAITSPLRMSITAEYGVNAYEIGGALPVK